MNGFSFQYLILVHNYLLIIEILNPNFSYYLAHGFIGMVKYGF